MHVLFTTTTKTFAFFQFLHAMHVKQANTSSEASVPAFSVVAVIGAEGSPRTMEMASLFSLFEVPQLSYASSSALLDDARRYSYFSRIVPSDNMQVSVRAGRKGGKRWDGAAFERMLHLAGHFADYRMVKTMDSFFDV